MIDKNNQGNEVMIEEKPKKHLKHRSRGRSAKNYSDHSDSPGRIHKESQKQSSRKEVLKIVERSSNFEDRLDLPELYHSTYVTLVARDPYCLFAYWEIDASAAEEMSKKIGDKLERAVYTLRLFDVTCIDFNGYNAHWWRDYDELYIQNRYIDSLGDNAVFCAEIGVRTEDGGFYPFARSNFCSTPRAHISNRNDLIWQENSDDFDGNIFINVKLFNRKARAALNPRADWQMDTSRITLSKDDLKKYYENRQALNKQSKSLASLIEQNMEGIEVVDGDIYIESSLIPGLMKNEMFKFKPIGSSDELVKKPDMPFEIEMELTVKGKTKTDASVYLGGKQLKLNPDGSFTLKYKLGDDFLPFNFTAISKEKDAVRKIKTSVLRSKTESE